MLFNFSNFIFPGMSMEIYAIVNGNVLPYILDPNFEKYLPVIPSEVSYVNFTWKSGMKKYYYNFDRLQSFDERILEAPVISIKTRGRVPKRPKEFSILLPCLGNSSGVAAFGIGLLIESRKGRPLNGTPLRLKLRKECSQRGKPHRCSCFALFTLTSSLLPAFIPLVRHLTSDEKKKPFSNPS